MNSQKVFHRMIWNFLIAIGIVLSISLLVVGVAYATNGDWGDLPDGDSFPVSYDGLTLHGAVHDPDGLMLGLLKDSEANGQPHQYAGIVVNSVLPGGDDGNGEDDEDGITRGSTYWTNETTVTLDVVVTGCTVGSCFLNGWIDWGVDGSFAEVHDRVFVNASVTNGTNTLNVNVPHSDFYTVGEPVFARFRLCSSNVVGSNNSCMELVGHTTTGEVEDYYWEFGPTAVELVSIEANTNYAVPFALLAGALILLFSGGAILAFKRNRA